MIVDGQRVPSEISFDVNPTSRQMLENLTEMGYLGSLIASGARIHQAGCNGCIGMGQAPAPGKNSLRTVPRNFPGRTGTREDSVFLCSPETADASALTGEITDPRTLEDTHGIDCPDWTEPEEIIVTNQR
jgi:aconitate hydratase